MFGDGGDDIVKVLCVVGTSCVWLSFAWRIEAGWRVDVRSGLRRLSMMVGGTLSGTMGGIEVAPPKAVAEWESGDGGVHSI